ncbi:phosphotransferase [Halotalea alkalilenta]|uniref:phosphotransferase n=1 Tax=Halotalea alkalilenta TaxID=376489 RepID=UPI0004880D87|nr:phosphotransferase [Halotalea alkalilenta]
MSGVEVIDAVLSAASPPVSCEQAEAFVAERYGLRATARALGGERDRNFHLRGSNGHDYVLKIAHPAERAEIADFHTQALLHLARTAPLLPVPRVVTSLSGETVPRYRSALGAPCVARLSTYLHGQPLADLPVSSDRRRALGTLAAELDLALEDFHHPAMRLKLPWDLQHAADLRPLIETIIEPGTRQLAIAGLERFERHAAAALAGLRRQAIHNDLNSHNLLVDEHGERVAGIIDFGDMVCAPRINELAIAVSYQLALDDTSWHQALAVVEGYHRVAPLQAIEVGLLPELVIARLMMVVTISQWRAARAPDNADYVLRNHARARRALVYCLAQPREALIAQLLSRLGVAQEQAP